jgi:hypothetical protein
MCTYQFDLVYRGLFMELLKFGKITEMVMCDNLHEPLRGSLYVVFEDPKAGEKCRKQMNQRLYDGKPLKPIIIATESLENLVCPAFLKNNCQGMLSSDPDSRCLLVHVKFVSNFIRKLLTEYAWLTRKVEKYYSKAKP